MTKIFNPFSNFLGISTENHLKFLGQILILNVFNITFGISYKERSFSKFNY